MLALRIELSTALRGLDRVDPRERSAFAKRIKTHIDALSARIAAHDADVEQAKAKLIARAEKLGGIGESRATSPRQARELQVAMDGARQWSPFDGSETMA